jgi:hypothetical protein
VLSKVRAMQEENRRLDQTVVELQNSVAERQNIWRIRQRDAPLPGSTEVCVFSLLSFCCRESKTHVCHHGR